jgi:RHS repeat-associated protein
VAQSYTYDSFGNQTASSGSLTNYFRYTGREFDTETNLYYYRARYYDPTTGRFASQDPLGFIGGPNAYAYTVNDPILLIDPSGLYSWGQFVTDAVNAIAGAGDTLSFGLSAYARNQWGDFFYPTTARVVNPCSGAYFTGVAVGVTIDAVLLDEADSIPNDTQIKVALHDAHHPFGPLGKLPHIQVNVWQNGIPGSGFTLPRIPLPW